ncbi:choice-of-anchor P family protein [Microbaculum marinum]|uniref:Choice-of-anchor P family protein n=1 Tax=Microbaculum marinum TaxID=1764581 RepID=A0AAW9RW25_9HYPH
MTRIRKIAVAAPVWLGLAVGAATAAELPGHFLGQANTLRTETTLDSLRASIDRAAYTSAGCLGTNGKWQTNRVNGLGAGSEGEIAHVGLMLAKARTQKSSTSAVNEHVARVDDVELLDGVITADAIKAVANIKATKSKFRVGTGRSEFVNLRVLGNLVDADIEDNSVIQLPGLGQVVIKAVNRKVRKSSGKIQIEMLRVEIDEVNSFDIPVGTIIVVADAMAGYSRFDVDNAMFGAAYLAESNAKVGTEARDQIGRPGLIRVGCKGTNGKVRTIEVAEIAGGDLLTTAGGKSTGMGKQTSTGVKIRMTSTVADVDLLDGLVTAEEVRSVSTDTVKEGTRKSSSKGTQVLDLMVNGVPIGDVTERNVSIDIPLVGTLYVNEVRKPKSPKTKQFVTGLRLKVDGVASSLTSGAELVVARSQSQAF